MKLSPWGALSAAAAAPGAMAVPSAQVLSPWADDSFLERVVVPDIWPAASPMPLTRGEAMLVPAVARARHLICTTVAGLPLWALRGAERVNPQPYWCQGTDGQLGDLTAERAHQLGLYTGQSPYQRMLWTADDLLFYGWSLWLVTRRDPADDRPARLLRLPYASWSVDADTGAICDPDGHPFDAGQVVLLQGMSEGVLANGARTVRTAGELETTTADVAARPIRVELHQVTDVTLDAVERRQLVDEVRRALADNNGVLFTNAAVETKDHPMGAADVLIGGRNASAVDVARHLNVPADLIDATIEGGSLTYATTESRNAQWLTYGLTGYLDPIAAALSMDQVVPSGQRVAFDTTGLTELTPAPTGPALED